MSDLVFYYKYLHDLVALPSSEYFTMSNFTSQTQTGAIDCSVLYALLDIMKTTSLIAVYLVGIFYHIQWLIIIKIIKYLYSAINP